MMISSLLLILFLFCIHGVDAEDGFLITTWVGDIGCFSPGFVKRELFFVDDQNHCFLRPNTREILSVQLVSTWLFTGKTIEIFQVMSYPSIKYCQDRARSKSKRVHKFVFENDQPECRYNKNKGITQEGRVVNTRDFLGLFVREDNDFLHHVYDGGPTCSNTRYILLEKNEATNRRECPSTGECVYHASIDQSERKTCTIPSFGSFGDDSADEEETEVKHHKDLPEAEAEIIIPSKKKEREAEGEIVLLIALIGAGVITLVIGSLLLCLVLTVVLMISKDYLWSALNKFMDSIGATVTT